MAEWRLGSWMLPVRVSQWPLAGSILALSAFSSFDAAAATVSPGRIDALTEQMDFWRANAPRCAGPSGYAFPSGEQQVGGVACEDGDMVLFNGMLCASGEAEGCEMVLRSQVTTGPDTGRWYRSPRRMELGNDHDQDGKLDDEIDHEDLDGDGRFEEQEWNSFSPDMSLGVMLALSRLWADRAIDPGAASSAQAAGQAWWDYLAQFSPTQCQRVLVATLPAPFGKQIACVVPSRAALLSLVTVLSPICPPCATALSMPDVKFFCNHWGCIIRPGDYALLGEFERFLDLKAPNGAFRGGIGTFLPYAADNILSSARLNDDDYPEHLTAASILLMRLLGQSSTKLDEAAALLPCIKKGLSIPQRDALDASSCVKESPDNPFFTYLRDGPSDGLVDMLLEACPVKNRMPDENHRYEWMWEKEVAHRSWQRSMYWDCIFMGRLLCAA